MAREIDLLILLGFSLCTYEILYFLPDRPRLLVPAFVLQKHDLAPKFPELQKFLEFWEKHIEARIHSVKVASQQLIRPAEYRFTEDLRLH